MTYARHADRMMMTASLGDDGVAMRFVDGSGGLIPFSDVPEVMERSELSGLELPNPYEIVLRTIRGERVEIPWDFARHYCDETYRPAVEAIASQGRQSLGERIRQYRKSAGLTQDELARSANIGRVTLIRLENGEQSPRFRTLNAIAGALGISTGELFVRPDLLL